ncbi:E motif [Dillenia turbinata]|uniref:E motif n=1 Tax=Dillenia turbinata TaxID=194707 RepID=A0AAN8ZTQ4_9MAGN
MEIHLYQPNSTFIHNRLLHVYAKSGESSLAQKLFDKMPHRDIFSYNALLSAYLKSGFVEDMTVLFDRMPCRDPVSYNTVISGLVGSGCLHEAFDVFVGMQREGFEGTDYMYVSLLNSCAKLLDLKHGKQIHGRLAVCDYIGSAFIWNVLCDLYAKCGAIDHARLLFDRVDNRTVVSWNSIISGYLLNGHPERCLELFHDMQVSYLMPDQVTASNISNWSCRGCIACAELASMRHGEIIHRTSVRIGIELELLVSSSLVDMYSKCGNTADAWVVFEAMPTRNVVSWNSMILGYAQNGKDSEALALYAKMLEQNYKPDDITFVGVLSACNHAGYIDKAVDLVKEPLKAGPYVVLSKMYAACGRWKDVALIRSLMKNKNVKKFAAYGWIEIDNSIHKFVSEDRLHPESKQIYEEQEEKFESICYHSEKLALAFGLLKKPILFHHFVEGLALAKIIGNYELMGDKKCTFLRYGKAMGNEPGFLVKLCIKTKGPFTVRKAGAKEMSFSLCPYRQSHPVNNCLAPNCRIKTVELLMAGLTVELNAWVVGPADDVMM